MGEQQRIQVEVPGAGSVSALRTAPPGQARLLFVYAPGAGSNLNDPFGAYCAERLLGQDIESWRFQFPYTEAGRRMPDATPVLEATWRAVIEKARETGLPLAVGGRSMGGRIASQVVAQGEAVELLALFAYPLHPPGRPDRMRTEHLASISVPAFFCSGTRDTFASPDELRQAAALVSSATLHLIEGADHGFTTLWASGRTRQDAWSEAVAALLRFVDANKPPHTPS